MTEVELKIFPHDLGEVEFSFFFLTGNLDCPDEIPNAIQSGVIFINKILFEPLSKYLDEVRAFINHPTLISFLKEKQEEWTREFLAMLFNVKERDLVTIESMSRHYEEWRERYRKAMEIVNKTEAIGILKLPFSSIYLNIGINDFRRIRRGESFIVKREGFLSKVFFKNTEIKLYEEWDYNIFVKAPVFTLEFKFKPPLIEILEDIFVRQRLAE